MRETDRVPLRPREACYAWRLHFKNAVGDVAWRGEFTLPAKPGAAPTLLETKKSEKPLGGWIGDSWCVTRGDPVGDHMIKVYIRDSLARTFTFAVVAPDDASEPARGDAAAVDPLGTLRDFSVQRESLEAEFRATYPKPPQGLDADTANLAVLLLDLDLKGNIGWVEGAALTRGNAGEPIRAAEMKGSVVLFHALDTGTYSLRFIKVQQYNRDNLVLEKPPFAEINVTVPRGGIYYLGTVAVIRKRGLTGFKAPEFEVLHDPKRELQAWLAFAERYVGTPWAALAERRTRALQSP